MRETPVNTQGNLDVERIGLETYCSSSHIGANLDRRVLDEATEDIDVAIDRARREIGLLGEYRTRLIADVVTRKADVREAVAQFSRPSD